MLSLYFIFLITNFWSIYSNEKTKHPLHKNNNALTFTLLIVTSLYYHFFIHAFIYIYTSMSIKITTLNIKNVFIFLINIINYEPTYLLAHCKNERFSFWSILKKSAFVKEIFLSISFIFKNLVFFW